MTNAEKFVEVFGTDLKRQYATKTWWEQEFIPNKAIPTGWIPVSERLPEEYGEYLITWTSDEIMEQFVGMAIYEIKSYFSRENFRGDVRWLFEEQKTYKNVEVLAWMPLPEPYEADMRGEK